ncbi:MAG TPA: rod shape-determining protein MreD [Terriglobales bacterium]|nr:rod shape-determining protein MreD [Terriglobales bacterium]
MNILYTSREQVAVYKFSLPVCIAVPLLAIFFQTFVSVRFFWLAIFDLPLLVTIFFAVARRNPVSGLLTGGVIGIVQDSLTHHPLGLYGIAKTVIGYVASSLGVKLDVENPGSRMLMTFTFYLAHQGLFYLIGRGLAGQVLEIRWGHLVLAAVANALLAVPVFALLDRFRART